MSGPEDTPTDAPPRRLRVAVLNRVFAVTGGGAESYSIRLAEQLATRHDVHVFAQDIGHAGAPSGQGLTYHRIGTPLRKPRWLNQLWYATASWWHTRRGFDVVHSHENTWHGNVQTIHVKPVRYNLLAHRTGWRLALRWLKIVFSPRLATYVWLEAARFRPRPGRQVVVTSDNLRHEVLQVYPQAAPLLSVVTPGVALPQARPGREEARQALGVPPAAPTLLFVANDYERKGLASLLPALAQLPGDVQLVVVGNPAQAPRFRAQAGTLGLQGRVFFAGALADMAPAYAAADLLVHPTLDDTFAMVVLEAMAWGLPVVVSGPAHCGISSLLADGQQALLLREPRDAAELAQSIGRVLGDASLRATLSQQGHQFAQAHDWAHAAAAYEQIYFRSLAKR